ALWTGRVLSGLVIVFLLFDAVIKLIPLDVVVETSRQLGIPTNLAVTLGVLTLLGTLLYAYPRTSALGAILLTGYLGGAI
ncbi:DoxX family protein, partial [Klebsiella pneumoniae]|nr:DoxX family protein [Klebsiella pneumoniae]